MYKKIQEMYNKFYYKYIFMVCLVKAARDSAIFHNKWEKNSNKYCMFDSQ